MITIIIPTRNRAYTLSKVADSYYMQDFVDEIIFVDDCGDDTTYEVVMSLSVKYKHINTVYMKHASRKGTAAGRITGYTNATNKYIFFGEDDAFLEANYTTQLLEKFNSNNDLGLVSGRIIYLLPGEAQQSALTRFGNGIENKPYLNTIGFMLNKDAVVTGDFTVPFTHALFMTTKSLLLKYSYDPFYSKGNGFREETDYQLNLFANGYNLLVTNDTHCFHLHRSDVPSGGQRISRFGQLYWNVFYTNYMYDKYFDLLKTKVDIAYPKAIAKIIFSFYQFYILFIKPASKLPSIIYQKIT